jgi:hypothetical protein
VQLLQNSKSENWSEPSACTALVLNLLTNTKITFYKFIKIFLAFFNGKTTHRKVLFFIVLVAHFEFFFKLLVPDYWSGMDIFSEQIWPQHFTASFNTLNDSWKCFYTSFATH